MTPEVIRDLSEKLDRCIELLEDKEDPNRRLTEEEARKECYPLYPPLDPFQHGKADDASNRSWVDCNCGDHKHGELTGGWFCPVHGQCF